MQSFRHGNDLRIYTESMLMTITDTDIRTKIIISDIDDSHTIIDNNGRRISATKNRMAYVDKKIGTDQYCIAIDATDQKKTDPCIISCDPLVLAPYISREESLLLCAKNIKEYATVNLASPDTMCTFVAKDGVKVIVSHNFMYTSDNYYEYTSVPPQAVGILLEIESFDDCFNRLNNYCSLNKSFYANVIMESSQNIQKAMNDITRKVVSKKPSLKSSLKK